LGKGLYKLESPYLLEKSSPTPPIIIIVYVVICQFLNGGSDHIFFEFLTEKEPRDLLLMLAVPIFRLSFEDRKNQRSTESWISGLSAASAGTITVSDHQGRDCPGKTESLRALLYPVLVSAEISGKPGSSLE
jgi:hypothetical protein